MSSFWDRIQNPHCKKCSLHEDTVRVCSVTGKGSINSSILFVTGPPDYDEEVYGKPSVGSKGREFVKQLAEASWSLPYAMAPAICCRPRDDRAPKLAAEVRTCRNNYLLRTIQRMNPRIIICLGLYALKAVTDDNKFNIKNSRRKVIRREFSVRSKARGNTLRNSLVPIVVTFDPGAVLRSPHLRQFVVEDLEWFQSIIQGKRAIQEERTDPPVYILQGRDEDLGAAFGRSRILGFDIETTSLSPWDGEARILCAAVSDRPLHAAAFDIKTPHLRAKLEKVLKDKRTTTVAHNILFELTWMMKHGYKIRGPVFDTMVAFHLLNENYPDKSLAHLANLFLPGMQDYAGGMKDERSQFTHVDERLLEYCAKDADATRRLRDRFHFALRRAGCLRAFRLRMRAAKAIARMQVSGLRADRDRLDYHSERNRKDRLRLGKWFSKQVGPKFNPNSPAQVQKLLYQDLALTPTVFSRKTKKPSANEKALDSLGRRLRLNHQEESLAYKMVEKIQAYRTSSQVEKMFLKPFRETHVRWDGFIHPSFKLAGTVTGRLACAKPNVQQIPPGIRDIVVSRFEGGSIVKADFSQMELRVLAHCSQEPAMLEAFDSGVDIHTLTASKIFTKPIHKITPDERYLAKTVNFGVIYGMTEKRLAAETGMRLPDAQRFLAAFWKGLPEVRRWAAKVRRDCRRNGYVTSLFGVRRRLPIDDSYSIEGAKALRESVNHVIQSSASDITLVAFCDVNDWMMRARWKSRIINLVHDEITIDAHPRELDDLLIMVDEVGGSPNLKRYGVELTVPLELEIKVGPSWGEGEVVNA